MLAGLGTRYVYGLKDHMPAKMAIKMLGDKGWDWGEITRLDLRTNKDLDIKIISLDKQIADSEMQKDSRKEALMAVGADPTLATVVNPKWRAEEILRSIAGYEDVDVAEAMDTQTFGSKKSLAHASVAIQQMSEGKKPELYFGADTAFMQKIIDNSKEKQATDPKLAMSLVDYAMAHVQIVQQNMQQKAILMQQTQMQAQMGTMQGQAPQASGSAPQPQPQGNGGVPAGVSHAMNLAQQAG
jgi:hypothetical protein